MNKKIGIYAVLFIVLFSSVVAVDIQTNYSYGEMYIHFAGSTNYSIVNITAANVYFPVTGFTAGHLYNMNFSNNSLLILESGVYKIDYSVSYEGLAANQEYETVLFLNNTILNDSYTHRTIGNIGQVGNVGSTLLITVVAPARLSLFMEDVSTPAGNPVGVHAANVNIHKINTFVQSDDILEASEMAFEELILFSVGLLLIVAAQYVGSWLLFGFSGTWLVGASVYGLAFDGQSIVSPFTFFSLLGLYLIYHAVSLALKERELNDAKKNRVEE
jgi:hypothetical protein